MRRRVLIGSVQRLLPDGETVVGAAVLWTMTVRSIVLALGSGVMVLVASGVMGRAELSQRVLWSVLVGSAVAALVTKFRVMALTDTGYVVFDSSSIRQVATELRERLPVDVEPIKLGGNLATSDWSIDGEIWSVTKRGDRELERLMAHHRNR